MTLVLFAGVWVGLSRVITSGLPKFTSSDFRLRCGRVTSGLAKSISSGRLGTRSGLTKSTNCGGFGTGSKSISSGWLAGSADAINEIAIFNTMKTEIRRKEISSTHDFQNQNLNTP